MSVETLQAKEIPAHTSTLIRGRISAVMIFLIALGLLAANALSLYFLWERVWPIPKWSPLRFYGIFAANILAFPLGALALHQAIYSIATPADLEENTFLAKAWITCIAAAWWTYLFFTNSFLGTTFVMLWGCYSLPMNAVLLFRRPLSSLFHRKKILWGALALLFNIAFGLMAVEIGLHITRHFSKSIVFLDDTLGTEDYIERQRLKPGTILFDIAADERGFSDALKPKKQRKKGEKLVASIGGSFNVIATPLRYHFTSVAEQQTENLEIYCMGIRGIGLQHYPTLIRKDVLPLHPDAIVLTLFVTGLLPLTDQEQVSHPILRDWFSRDRCMILNTIPRIITLFQLKWERDQEEARKKREAAKKGKENRPPKRAKKEGPQDLKTILKYNPWLINPLLEKPWMKKERFLEVETERAINSCQINHKSYQWLRPLLKEIKDLAGDIPVFAILIPDEFQVEDQLWEQIVPRIPDWIQYKRFYPQERIQAELKKLGIPFVDCLEALRKGPKYQDGLTHYYLKRNTHINTRGSRVVGKLLAELLQKELHLKPKKKKGRTK